MVKPHGAVVRTADGREEPLGDWIVSLLKSAGVSVTDTMERAHLSRSFYYLLKDGKQVPSVESLVSLLEAIPVDEVRLAGPTDPGDLQVEFDGASYWIVLRHAGRRSVRSRSAWQSLNLSSDTPPMAARVDSDVSSGHARSYKIANGAPAESRSADERSRLLGELLSHAADLDVGRLRMLIAQADLLRDEW